MQYDTRPSALSPDSSHGSVHLDLIHGQHACRDGSETTGNLIEWLLADEIECLKHWAVAEREKHCLATVGGMLVPRPRRHDKGVTLGPIEPFAADDAIPPSLGHVIDGARGVAVRLRLVTRADVLQG